MNSSQPPKIAKLISQAGLCSRREAEEWVLNGRVTIDGEVITSPAIRVDDAKSVKVDGKLLRTKDKTRLWIYYKPVGLLTTHKDPQGRPTVFENLPESLPRVVSVGRLDLNSEGLLLLTNDGDFARYLEHPDTQMPRVYKVQVFGSIENINKEDLNQGLVIDGVRYKKVKVKVLKTKGLRSWLEFELLEGKNREIRRIVEFFGLKVVKLIRKGYGPFELNQLEPNEIKEVPEKILKKFGFSAFTSERSL